MRTLGRRVAPFEIKTQADAEADTPGVICTFSGLAACYYNLDWKGDIIDPAAFAADLPSLLADGVLRDEHCTTTGKIVAATLPAEGLFVKCAVLDTTAGRDQAALVRGRAVKRLSIGFHALERQWLGSPDEVKSYWQSKGYAPTDDDLIALGTFGGARLVTRARVPEVSTTWYPTNAQAQITEAKGGTRAGRSLADHSAAVLDAVTDYAERVTSLGALRAADGRTVGPETKTRLARVRATLDDLAASLETKAQAAPPPAADPQALYSEFLATCARLDGHAG